MNYQKRDCPIDFDLKLGGFYGSQSCSFQICGDKHDYWFSYAMGDLFGRLLNNVYGLCIEVNDPYTDHSIKYITSDSACDYRITKIAATTIWDSEGEDLEWTITRDLDNNEDKIVKITLDYNYGEKIYSYEVKLVDLCYALAKAVTNLLKESGFCGYHFSTDRDYIDIVSFLMVKHIALTGNRIDFTPDNYYCLQFSSLEQELELIRFDM